MASADDIIARILHAHSLLVSGDESSAETLLLAALPEVDASGDGPLIFAVRRMLGQCARTGKRFDEAQAHYAVARSVAEALKDPDMASAAVSGMAAVEVMDGEPRRAAALYEEAERLARSAGPGTGLAAVLQARAGLLHQLEDDRSADLYTEALAQPGVDLHLRGIITDNLADELMRQGRVDEALVRTRESAAMLRSCGAGFDAFKSLINLADRSLARDKALAAEAFAEAHELIHRLRDDLDPDHYAGFGARAAAIEAETVQRALAGELTSAAAPAFTEAMGRLGDAGAHVMIGVAAMMGKDAVEEASRCVMTHRYADAENALRMAEIQWESLGAVHLLPQVWGVYGLLYSYSGDLDRAWSYLRRSRDTARALGNPHTELTALVNMCMLANAARDRFEVHPLDILAQARAVAGLLDSPLDDQPNSWDLGALDSLEAELGEDYGALDIAERALSDSVATSQQLLARQQEPSWARTIILARLAQRWSRLGMLFARQGRWDDAANVRACLLRIADAEEEPDVLMPVYNGVAKLDLQNGVRTEEVLNALVRACEFYEAIRERGGMRMDDSGERRGFDPPYKAAVDLALDLSQTARAFDLLERSKSRALLDALRDYGGVDDSSDPGLLEEHRLWEELRGVRRVDADGTPHEVARRLWEVTEQRGSVRDELAENWQRLAAEHPLLRAHRLAEPVTSDEASTLLAAHHATALVEYFVGRDAVHAFVVTVSGVDSFSVIGRDDPLVGEFLELLASDHADTFDQVLAHPLFGLLAAVVDAVAGRGPVYVVPHGPLHLAPLHLTADGAARSETSLLPSASVLRSALFRPRPQGLVIVGGDPTGDLPATRAECRHVARRFGTVAASGAEVTERWLADRLSAGGRLVHLSCHGSFHELRPERSGLLLAGPDGQPDLVDLRRLSALAWSGAAVVLSACHTGRHRVGYGDELAGLGHTLLAAGAAAVVASLRPVPDLSTALMMTWLYDGLDVDARWTPRYLASALESAQRRMSESSARDLVEWADGHRRWGPEETLLACQVVAAALRAAGNVEEHVDWQEHVVRLRRQNTAPDDDAWARIRATAAGSAYTVRPFRQPAHWATFVVFGAV